MGEVGGRGPGRQGGCGEPLQQGGRAENGGDQRLDTEAPPPLCGRSSTAGATVGPSVLGKNLMRRMQERVGTGGMGLPTQQGPIETGGSRLWQPPAGPGHAQRGPEGRGAGTDSLCTLCGGGTAHLGEGANQGGGANRELAERSPARGMFRVPLRTRCRGHRRSYYRGLEWGRHRLHRMGEALCCVASRGLQHPDMGRATQVLGQGTVL